MNDLKIGTSFASVINTGADNFGIDDRFRMVKEAGVFDYMDKTVPYGELELYQAAVQKHGIPIRAGAASYVLGRDEPLLEWHLSICKTLGATNHNIQLRPNDADGVYVTNARVADAFLWMAEIGDKLGVTPSLETHINTWSENYIRVAQVGELVEKRGAKFNITLDHAHVMFKINNPREQEVQGMRADIEAGRLNIDPFKPNDACSLWIARGWAVHAHARAAAPNNPMNIWAKHPDGRFGRGIQYPFLRPAPGEWHTEWDEAKLEPWKEVFRRLLNFHATNADSRLRMISTEFLGSTEYGGGAKYSIFEHSIAAAKWLHETWVKAKAAS